MKNRSILLIALLIILAGVLYSALWPQDPITVEDTRGYLPVAADLADGHLEQLHFRTLGYPLILLFTGSTEAPTRALFYVQLLMHLVAVFLLALILLREFRSPWFAIAFTVLALLPPAIEYISIALPETTALFLLSIAVYLLYQSLKRDRVVPSLLSGLCLAYLAITRPDYQLLPLFLSLTLALVFVILRQKRAWLRSILPLLLVSLLGIGAYVTFNYLTFQFPGIAYYSGITSTAKTVTMLEEIPDSDAAIRDILIRHRNTNLVEGDSHTAVNYIFDALPELEALTHLSQPELSAKLNRLNLHMIIRDPLNYLVSVGRALAVFLMPSATTQSLFGSQLVQIVWTLLHFVALVLFVLLLAGLLGGLQLAFLLDKSSRDALRRRLNTRFVPVSLFLVGVLTMLYVTIVSILLSAGDPRYHVPAAPLALLSILTFLRFLADYRKKRVALVLKV